MGKYSNFERIGRDAYQTIDPRAVDKLMPHLRGVKTFAEPCAGEGYLVGQLQAQGLTCVYEGDIDSGFDALTYPSTRTPRSTPSSAMSLGAATSCTR